MARVLYEAWGFLCLHMAVEEAVKVGHKVIRPEQKNLAYCREAGVTRGSIGSRDVSSAPKRPADPASAFGLLMFAGPVAVGAVFSNRRYRAACCIYLSDRVEALLC
jgi:hypothetical protein